MGMETNPREVAVIDTLLNLVFRCAHRRLTRPVTPVAKGDAPHGTYVVCLDCGKEFGYDWQEMRVVSGTLSPTSAVRSFATKEAA